MRMAVAVFVVGTLLAGSTASSAGQDHHHPSPERVNSAPMGFDQELTTHHFLLFADGGAIDVTVKDAADITNRAAIRSHLPHIAKMFADGDFEAPMRVHDSKSVPGTRVMAARRQAIRYQYEETPGGGRVDIITTDARALAAVHEFLRFQIAEHKTGDSPKVGRR